jgi:3-oxoacyl-[acyl-carrier-protein] synthase-3
VLGPTRGTGAVLGAKLYSEGGLTDLLCIPPATNGAESDGPATGGKLVMKGREIFKIAVREMEDAAREILEQHGLHADEISCVIPHQANLRIIDAIAQYLELPFDRFFINVERYGNTSSASIPLALDEARRAGRIRPGDTTLLVAFGAGLTYGSALVRW